MPERCSKTPPDTFFRGDEGPVVVSGPPAKSVEDSHAILRESIETIKVLTDKSERLLEKYRSRSPRPPSDEGS